MTMEEGDEYVPNMQSMGGAEHPFPPYPAHHNPMHMHGSMGGGIPPNLPPNAMPPHMQHMHMQNPYMAIPSQQQQQPPQQAPTPPVKAKRSRKKAEPQQPTNPPNLDPMQRMAAMSHNPMGYQQQMQGFPPGYPPQTAYRSPYPTPHPQMYPSHMGSQSSSMARPPQPFVSPSPSYPPQSYPQYPGYPPQMPPQAMARYPPMAPPQGYYPMEGYYAGQADNGQAQMRQNRPPDSWPAPSQAQQPTMQNPYANAGCPPSNEGHAQQAQMEMMQCQQHLQRLYAQPRTPQMEQEIARFEQRIHQLQMQSQHTPTDSNGTPSQFPSSSFAPSFPPSNQMHNPPHMTSPPVSVTGSNSQIQVNIKPEQAGHTLISVYQMPEGGYPPGAKPIDQQKAADSIPPEPIPSQQNMQQHNNMPVDPYGITRQQTQQQQQQQHSEVNGVAQQPPVHPVIQQPPPQLRSPETTLIVQPPEEEKSESKEQVELNKDTSTDDEATKEALLDLPPRAPAPVMETEEEEEEEMEREERSEEKMENEEGMKEDDNGDTREALEDTVEGVTVEEEKDGEGTEGAKDEHNTLNRLNAFVEGIDGMDKEETTIGLKEEVSEEKKEEDEEKEIEEEEEKESNGKEGDESPQEVPLMATASMKNDDVTVKEEGSMDSMPQSMGQSEEGSHASTPVPVKATKKKGGGGGARTKGPAKKRKPSIDESDEDEDFIVQKKKSKKKKVVVEEVREDFPIDMVEKRRSGRTKATTQRYADDEEKDKHAAEVMRELDLMEEADESLVVDDNMGPYVVYENTVVEKILNMREKDGREEFLAKYKGRAYIHCEWKTLEELEEKDKRVGAKVKRFKTKKTAANSWMEMDAEDFNQDFTIIERVITVEKDGDNEIALVKWKALAYDEATWEDVSIVPEEKLEVWRKRQIIDPMKAKEKARPEPHEWKKLERDAIWKDGNTLREYQFEGVSWLLYCYHNKQNCILADEMGLGKTVQTITFLSRVADYGIHGPFLIVVPLSTVHNWMREFETWTDMNVVVYHGSASSRQILQNYEFFYNEPNEDDPNAKLWRPRLLKLDAIITTFEMVVTDVEVLRKIPFRICVIDEAHRLKNRNCKLLTGGLSSFKMEHRVLLTGTPLQNNMDELFSLLHFLHPAHFPSSTAFLEQFGQCQSDEQVQKLQEILKPMMLRRLKEDVEKTLEPKQETIVEVQLSDTQKKYYRAILERNFSHLCKGTNAPALMNAMMELRKCCNHPFLIQGAEEQIVSEFKIMHPEWDEEQLQTRSLVLASGKMVLIEKLLPKLKQDGHKVLIFSQMVKVLDLIEEFLVSQQYTFERIDGNVRGDVRQAAIDRFSKPDSDRFVFLLCTRAGGLGINLTAADTVIIFDSDWNPQNDLQAQARCHRIGQTKTVKVYRLVTANTYEREMFEKASLKLGLDKAVLQSTHALRDQGSQLSKKDVEELLKKGAYGSILDDDNEGSKFNEEDIDTILQRRTTTITLEAGVKGSTFSKATFNASHNEDIDIDDPNFWSKWAQKANVDAEKALAGEERELIVSEPRQRKKRFEPTEGEGNEESDSSEGSTGNGRRRKERKDRKRRKDEDSDYVTYRPDELAFTKSEYFKVERLLGCWTWGRWTKMKESGDLEFTEMDVEHMARTLLLHCLREYRGDDRTKEFVWKLIHPTGQKSTRLGGKMHLLTEGWAANPEYNPPNFALDSSFQRHVHRHANKLLVKVEQLCHLEKEVIGSASSDIINGKDHSEIKLNIATLNEALCSGWDSECDKSLIIAVYRYGLEGIENVHTDEKLVFASKKEVVNKWPSLAELQLRVKRLIALSQRAVSDPVYDRPRWNRRDEQEFMRILRSYGMMDRTGDGTSIEWEGYRRLSSALEKKTDDELQEQLYCILAMCTRVQGGDLSPIDIKRALSVEPLSMKKAAKLMNRLHLTRKIHAMAKDGVDVLLPLLKLCSTEAMPSGWTAQHDKDLLLAVHEYGIDNISTTLLNRPLFQKIIRPAEKTLLRRVMEICLTCETGKWNGTASLDSIDDSDDERKVRVESSRASSSSRRQKTSTPATSDKEACLQDKMRNLLQQSLLAKQLEEMPLTLVMQSMLQASMGGSGSSSAAQAAAAQQAQAALLHSLFALPSTSQSSISNAAALEDALNLCKKERAEAERQALAAASALFNQQERNAANLIGLQMLTMANLPGETRIPVVNVKTKEKLQGETAPQLKTLESWLASHPDFTLDLTGTSPSTPSTSSSKDKPSSSTVIPSSSSAISSGTSTPRSSVNTVISKTTAPVVNSPKLEPGEIPKASTSSASTSSSVDPPVPVCSRSKKTLLPQSEWPPLSKLTCWLDSHTDANVHVSGLAIALPVLGVQHMDRIGGSAETAIPTTAQANAATKQQLEQQLQMSLLLQHSLLANPLLLAGMGSMPTTSKQDEAMQQQLLLSMLANPMSLQGLADPSLLLAAASLQSALPATRTPSCSSSRPTLSSSSSSQPSSSTPKTSKKPSSKLAAVVEKLANNQS